jgi:HEAT repeat protein
MNETPQDEQNLEQRLQEFIRKLNDPHSFGLAKDFIELGHLKDPRLQEALINGLGHTNSSVRCNAAFFIKTPYAVEPLIRTLDDPNSEVRAAAAQSLGLIGDKRAVEALIRALDDPDCEVHYAVFDAFMISPDRRATKPLIKVLRGEGYERVGAAFALAEIRDERSIEPLLEALHDPNEELQGAALYALKQIIEVLTLPELERFSQQLSDETPRCETLREVVRQTGEKLKRQK